MSIMEFWAVKILVTRNVTLLLFKNKKMQLNEKQPKYSTMNLYCYKCKLCFAVFLKRRINISIILVMVCRTVLCLVWKTCPILILCLEPIMLCKYLELWVFFQYSILTDHPGTAENIEPPRQRYSTSSLPNSTTTRETTRRKTTKTTTTTVKINNKIDTPSSYLTSHTCKETSSYEKRTQVIKNQQMASTTRHWLP